MKPFTAFLVGVFCSSLLLFLGVLGSISNKDENDDG